MSDPSQQYPQQGAPSQSGGSPGAPTKSPAARITVADLIAGAGALITFIFSFLDFFTAGDAGVNAWSTDYKGFAAAIPALLALALLVLIGLGFAHVTLPERMITFTWDQIKATWGITSAGIMISFIAAGAPGGFENLDKGAGFWFMLIGSLAMAIGTVMKLLGAGTNTVAIGTTSASPGGPDPYQAGAQGMHPPGGSAPAPPPPSDGAPPPPPSGGAPPLPPPGP